ncbi:PREDICTED: DDT domain-containing protein DDB_G0282237-like isoform X2 [Lupinus angustifolius]|uniref:DDT domain-containing protein DDB_G0282237-like isoform X2 n=1 Tax=Lupinus angustifolius TaxID=3871 RepID=UPI00092F2480|nr:PREDICTED: DDT domain-containing protein DDB_G0282237-like isoform X2 [Lupinus angustifolius]
MPLLRRKPSALAEPPKDLKPDELVYQIRFTKEIFRDYHEYLNFLNLYRQRIWMCKVSGKTGLTYEEALVSEQRATEKVQQFPKELTAPALQIIQYSMLPLKDLADSINEKLLGHLFVGAELFVKKDDGVYPCKILKVILEGVEKCRYEVVWLNKDKNITETTYVCAEDLVQKKPLFSRNILKSFIRESTYRNAPWVLHEELAQKHGISTDIPEVLRGRVFFKNGILTCSKKRKNEESMEETEISNKRKNVDCSAQKEGNDQHIDEPIKYPIDDLLVKPGPDDPVFTTRPSPSRDFNIPMDCVGDLLMIWDFCTSFAKLLHLWPYSPEDFENAIRHRESNVVLLVESHAALFRVLINDDGEYSTAIKKRRSKYKITMINWSEYLSEFIEMINIPGLHQYEATIKRGQYGLVDVNAKLEILSELVNRVLETGIFRGEMDKLIEERQVLGASRREEALEDGRKRRKKKEQLKAGPESNGVVDGNHLNNASVSTNNNHGMQNGDVGEKRNGEIKPSRNDTPCRSGIKHLNPASKKTQKKVSSEVEEPIEHGKVVSSKKLQKQLKGDKDPSEKNCSEQRKLNLELKETTENGKELSGKKLPKQLNGETDPSEQNSVEQRREYFEREMDKRLIRRSPLGKDRDYNRYWWFPRDGRLFVESSDSKEWGYYSSKEEVDALMGSLNCKGERERALQKQLGKYYKRICSELQKRSKDLMHKDEVDESVVRRSTRVRAPPRQNPANAFLRYVNKWKEE